MRYLLFVILLYAGIKSRAQYYDRSGNTDGARNPQVTALERKLYPHYSACYRCGRPWNCCHTHMVFYKDSREKSESMFALCEDCWNDCDLAHRKAYYIKAYHYQVQWGMKDDHLPAILQAIENDSK